MRHTDMRIDRRLWSRNEPDRRLAVVITMVVALPLTSCVAAAEQRSAGADASPIRIERCAVLSRSVLQDPLNGLRMEFVSGIAVRLRNIGRTSVASVNMMFGYQGSSRTIVDRGTFAPGSSVDRTYETFAGMTSGSDVAACRVVSVTFTDGTIWKTPP